MKRYHLNYFCCGLSILAAIVSALIHSLPFLLINFFFAVWNYYVAEYLVRLEKQQSEDSNEESSDEDGNEQQ